MLCHRCCGQLWPTPGPRLAPRCVEPLSGHGEGLVFGSFGCQSGWEAPTRQGPCGRRQQQRGGPVVCRWGEPRGLPTRSGHIRDTSSDCGFRARSKAHPPQLCQPGGHQCDAAWMGQWPSSVPSLDPGAGRRGPGRRSLPSPTAV